MSGNSLKEIFERMNQAVNGREPDIVNPAVCLCKGASSKLYICRSDEGRVLAVCPACNPRTNCTKCSGTGHLTHFNLQTLNNEIVPHGCACTTLEKRVSLFAQANVPAKYLEVEFSVLDTSHLNPDQIKKFTSTQDKIYNFCTHADNVLKDSTVSAENYFLALMGPVGTGKTHLAISALRRLTLDFGHHGKFVDFQFLLQELKDCYAKKKSEEEVMAPLRNAPILLIDEFGKGRTENEWQLEKLDDLVNSRYNNGRITIITTNYLTPELYKVWKSTQRSDVRAKSQLPPGLMAFDSSETKAATAGETFYDHDLSERIGQRMYDRIVEVSLFVDFVGLPSFRRLNSHKFLKS